MQIEINNPYKSVADSLITKVLKGTFGLLVKGKKISPKRKVQISVAMVSAREIQGLNLRYRSKDVPTDVLSFCYDANEEILNGEIVICPAIIRKNSAEDSIDFKQELMKNLIHGSLHIAGFGHGKKMFDLQEKILSAL